MNVARRLSERPAALFLLILVLCAAGVWTAIRLPSAIFPTVTFPRVKVIAEGAEEPAAQMIPAITRPLEEAIHRAGKRFLVAGIAGLAGATVLAGWLAYAGSQRGD